MPLDFSKIKKVLLKRKNGDSAIEGRLNDAIVLTYDTSTEKGIIDIHSGRNKTLIENDLHKTKARIVIAENSEIDNEYTKKVGQSLSDNKSSKVVIVANEIRLVSENGKKIQPLILGDELVSVLKDLLSALQSHTHTSAAPGSPTTNSLDMLPKLQKLSFKIKKILSSHIGCN